MAAHSSKKTTRRTFLKTASAAVATAAVGPTILHATKKSGTKTHIVGEGDYQYEVQHGWGELPDHIIWGETHGVAVDAEGLVYLKHRSHAPEPMDAIAVFDPDGKFVRSFGKEYHEGGHGIDVRKEGNEEFLYLSDTKHGIVAKTTLKGEVLWRQGVPKDSGVYTPGKRYSPTNLAFGPDGNSVYVGDGYGSHYIHLYDKDGNYKKTFGGTGSEPGKMKTPHGIWLDDRPGREPSLVVADRANGRMQYFSLDGKHLSFIEDVSFPADIDIQGEIMLVPDLHARITLFDKDNKVLTHLGYDAKWTEQVLANGLKLRRDSSKYRAGKFVHPHDACFDKAGNIFVAEWVPKGRISFLKKVS
jgi:DNA-binding beta-propeller fold protein YncE